jgi:hypothetical protein
MTTTMTISVVQSRVAVRPAIISTTMRSLMGETMKTGNRGRTQRYRCSLPAISVRDSP